MSDLTIQNKAPSRRMNAIISTFRKMNVPLCVISGSRKERNKKANDLLNKKLDGIDAVYVESSNSGLMINEFRLLATLRKKQIPISVFIRDGYPFFKEYWNIKYYKQIISNILWIISVFAYKKFAKTLYFPSVGLADFFRFDDKRILSPATFINENKLNLPPQKTLFYTGGIGQQYDITTFLMACDKLSSEIDFEVVMYCRESEIYRIYSWLSKSWLKIEHKNLEELDFQPTLGIIPLKKNAYSDLSFSVKLLDYVGLGSVILASDSSVIKEYIQKHRIGIIVNSGDVESYYCKIKEILSNEDLYEKLLANVEQLRNSEEITWENRCQKILDDFGFEK